MISYNRVMLMGNLTRDPELRYTPSGTPVANLRMAVNRTYKTLQGEERTETCFITVVTMGKQAVPCSEFLGKGSLVFVEGRLQSRSWESDGQKKSVIEVVANRVQFLSTKRRPLSEAGQGTIPSPAEGVEEPPAGEGVPQAEGASKEG